MRYAARRHYTWSPAIAYSVGLMASDGCLSRDGRHLNLTSTDIEQLENFARAIGRDLPVKQKIGGAGTTSYFTQFSDVAYYDFLMAAGLTPAKSTTIGRLSIPDEYYSDFLRGVFDGDGSCYAYIDTRWKSSYMFYVTFASASPPFLCYLREQNAKLAHTTAGSLRQSGRAHILSYAKADATKLFALMYYSEETIRLERKYTKLRGFTNAKKNDRIA